MATLATREHTSGSASKARTELMRARFSRPESTLCPGRKERMRRLMELVRRGRVDLRPLLTHTFTLDEITRACDLFANRKDGVLKVAIRP